jgi:hypothetical protein
MMTADTKFELWLEWEEGDPLDQPANRPSENFGNVTVTFSDGRRYALNVWTFDFLPLARFPWPHEMTPSDQPAMYVLPPDLFVERLDRATMEAVVAAMVAAGDLKEEWRCDRGA